MTGAGTRAKPVAELSYYDVLAEFPSSINIVVLTRRNYEGILGRELLISEAYHS